MSETRLKMKANVAACLLDLLVGVDSMLAIPICKSIMTLCYVACCGVILPPNGQKELVNRYI